MAFALGARQDRQRFLSPVYRQWEFHGMTSHLSISGPTHFPSPALSTPLPFPSYSICVWVRDVGVGEERLGKVSSIVLHLIPQFSYPHFAFALYSVCWCQVPGLPANPWKPLTVYYCLLISSFDLFPSAFGFSHVPGYPASFSLPPLFLPLSIYTHLSNLRR